MIKKKKKRHNAFSLEFCPRNLSYLYLFENGLYEYQLLEKKCLLCWIINSRQRSKLKQLPCLPTLGTHLGVDDGGEEREWGRKGRKRKPITGISKPEGHFFFKIKNTNQFHSNSKSRKEWGIWLAMFRNEWFLEIDCDWKIERFCLFKEELQFPHTQMPHLISSPHSSLLGIVRVSVFCSWDTGFFLDCSLLDLGRAIPVLQHCSPRWQHTMGKDSPTCIPSSSGRTAASDPNPFSPSKFLFESTRKKGGN